MSHTCKICGGEHWPNQPVYLLDCYQRGYARLKTEVAAAEERGRRAGIEAMQLGTCRVYIHGCADGRAIEPRPNWREYALPHPKRDNCTDWIALAPRDSGHEVGVLTDDNATRITAPKDRK